MQFISVGTAALLRCRGGGCVAVGLLGTRLRPLAGCRLEGLAHAADVRARGGRAEPAPLQAVRQGGDAHPQPLSRAFPGAVRVPAVPRHVHALRQPAHALQVQAPRVQPGHAQVRAAARAAPGAAARAALRQPPGRGLRLIVHVLARPRRSVSALRASQTLLVDVSKF